MEGSIHSYCIICVCGMEVSMESVCPAVKELPLLEDACLPYESCKSISTKDVITCWFVSSHTENMSTPIMSCN